MRFLGNINCLKQDSMAYRIYDKLNSILKDGDDSLLYHLFPVYSGNIDTGKVKANLMLLSLNYGIFYFTICGMGNLLRKLKSVSIRYIHI